MNLYTPVLNKRLVKRKIFLENVEKTKTEEKPNEKLKTLTELALEDEYGTIKFEFNTPHCVKIVEENNFYYIYDDYLDICDGGKTEKEALESYTIFLDFFYRSYIENEKDDLKMTRQLKEKCDKIEALIRRIL